MSLGVNPTLFLVFICAAATIYAMIRIVAPFLEDPEDQMRIEMLDEELEQIEKLVARKSVLLQSLQDIEFDYETGKLSDEDYERLKNRYEHQAVRVMRELDEVRGGVDMEDAIDDAVRERLAEETPKTSEEQQDATAPPASESASREARHCPQCGRQLESDARFCSGCGVALGDALESSDAEDSEEKSARESADRNAGTLRSEATGS